MQAKCDIGKIILWMEFYYNSSLDRTIWNPVGSLFEYLRSLDPVISYSVHFSLNVAVLREHISVCAFTDMFSFVQFM